MKICLALILLVLSGCSSHAAQALLHPKELSGSYLNQASTYKTGLFLSDDGKGAMLSRNNDNSFKEIMTFHWGVSNNVFYMSDIYFSNDGKRINKALSDDHTSYKLEGSNILSQGKSGEWMEWKRTSNQPDLRVVNAIITK